MPELRSAIFAPQPVNQVLSLPSAFPPLPEAIRKRFGGEADEYNDLTQRWWSNAKRTLSESHFETAAPINQVKRDLQTLSASFTSVEGTFTAFITEERDARIDADTAIAERTLTLESQVQTAGTGLLARIQTVETTYATTSSVGASITSAITAEVADRNTAISSAAGVITEAFAAADNTLDGKVGNLTGKYTLKVVAGNVVTGMNITSSSGPGGDISDVTFQAGSFKIYNGSAGVAPFQVVGGQVRVQNLAIVSSDVSGLAAVATSGTYSDIGGAKPPVGADVTLTALGNGLSISSGGVTLSGTAQIKSWNYNPGSAGWAILPDGTVDFNNGTFRGVLSASSGSIGGFSIGANILSAGSGLNAIAFSSVTNPFFRIGDVAGYYAEIRTIGGSPQCTVNYGGTQLAYIAADTSAGCGVVKVLNSGGSPTIQLWGNSGGIISVGSGGKFEVNGQQVVGARQTAPSASTVGYSPSGTYSSDAASIYSAFQNHMNTINAIRTALIAHGLLG